jgi:CBS domain-containing protein
MKIKDIMTKNIISITPEASLKELATLIKQHRINGVPVVTKEGALVGIVTMTDILKILRDIYYWAELENVKPGLGVKDALMAEKEKATVGTKMTTGVRTAKEDDTVEDILKLMCKYNIHTIPVVKDDKLVGIVGVTDIVYTVFNV